MFVQGPQYESVPFPSSRRRRRRRRLRRRLRRRRRRRRSSSSRSSGRKTTALAAAADRIIFLVIFAVVDIVGWFFLLANNIRWTTPRAGEIRTCSYKACSTESYPSLRVVFFSSPTSFLLFLPHLRLPSSLEEEGEEADDDVVVVAAVFVVGGRRGKNIYFPLLLGVQSVNKPAAKIIICALLRGGFQKTLCS